ncbi:MAG: hypothetical protein J3Q66DRAFT_385352 [Benniella sp.]|nr:MAG: hypothetical protein J3Q66DRAFT_385352 [Benniella sp.]
MDTTVQGDKYVRTLAHYFRHNKKRLIPTADLDSYGNLISNCDSSGSSTPDGSKHASPLNGVRSIITPADPMAAVYDGMVSSLRSVVNSVVPLDKDRPKTLSEGLNSYNGAWDGTGTIPADLNPRERQLYLQAHLKGPIFPLDLYYLLYLLDRFDEESIVIEGWDGITPRSVGDSKPRVLNANTSGNGMPPSSTYSSFPPPNASARPQSIRSFSSTALSTLTLITGWKQWSNAASSSANNMTVADDIHFIHKFLQHIHGLRLVAKIVPGVDALPSSGKARGRIEGFNGDGILNVLSSGHSYSTHEGSSRAQQPLLLPLGATFSSLTHLELHKIPPRSVDGWEVLMPRLKSLVLIQASIGDIYDIIVTAVVESERRRRQRATRERNREVWIKQERREALKDASTTTKGRPMDSTGSPGSGSPTLGGESLQSPPSPLLSSYSPSLIPGADATSESDEAILDSLRMWPVLRNLSVSDNSLPGLENHETFSYAQAVVTLDLSHNLLIAPPSGLIHLHNLHNLNLSFNMISSVQAIYQILGNVTVLDLRGNRLESLCGLERLWNLEKIDVRENLLDEAAEVGRLAAIPGIREVWADMNPFCTTHPKYRLEILAVFKANGHELLLDGMFASFSEKRALTQMSPTSFSSTISSVLNQANIPAATAPTATLSKELASSVSHSVRPSSDSTQYHSSDAKRSGASGNDSGLNATVSAPGVNPNAPPPKLVKKILLKAPRRVQRVVNLDSDHDEDGDHDSDNHEARIGKKKKSTSKKASASMDTGMTKGDGDTEKKTRKKSTTTSAKKTKKKSHGAVSFADDDGLDHHDDDKRSVHHVHRSVSLQQSMNAAAQANGGGSNHHHQSRHHHPPHHPPHLHDQHDSNDNYNTHLSPDDFSKAHHDGAFGSRQNPSSPKLRPSSPFGSCYSSDGEGGAEGYRRKIEAMRDEAGSNWLKVLAEMDNGSDARNGY